MPNSRAIWIIGTIEIAIGNGTLLFNLAALTLSVNPKSPGVLFFVLTSALASTLIGIGILRFNKIAYQLLLYFSSVVIFSKILIFLNVISLNGALETTIPGPLKNSVSIIYHGILIYFLQRADIKKIYNV